MRTEHDAPELTADCLDEWDSLADAATPGPWWTLARNGRTIQSCMRGDDGEIAVAGSLQNAAYIAAMNPETGKALLAEVRGLRERVAHEAMIVPAWPAVLLLNRGCPAFCDEWNCPFDYGECERSQVEEGKSPHIIEECWRELDRQQRAALGLAPAALDAGEPGAEEVPDD